MRHWVYVFRSWLVVGARRLYRRLGGITQPRASQITDQLYLGGFFDHHDWDILQQQGVNAVVNLQAERRDRFGDHAPPNYLWLPTIDHTSPSQADLQRGVAFVNDAIKRGQRVLIHCHAGMSRSATLAAAVLVNQGYTPDQAIKLLQAKRPVVHLHPWQHDALLEFAQSKNQI